MTTIKKYALHSLYTLLIVIITMTLLTLAYHYNLLPTTIYQFLKFILFLLIIFISALKLGKKTPKNGYLEGIKLGTIIIIICLLFTLLFGDFKLRILLYDCIIMITSILGSMVGINRKK